MSPYNCTGNNWYKSKQKRYFVKKGNGSPIPYSWKKIIFTYIDESITESDLAKTCQKARFWERNQTDQRLALLEKIGDEQRGLGRLLRAEELHGEVPEHGHPHNPRHRLPEPWLLLLLRLPSRPRPRLRHHRPTSRFRHRRFAPGFRSNNRVWIKAEKAKNNYNTLRSQLNR